MNYIILYYVTLYYIILYELYYIILYYTLLNFTKLYYLDIDITSFILHTSALMDTPQFEPSAFALHLEV
jgi:hypothetical protein